jgi:hypothetical protein
MAVGETVGDRCGAKVLSRSQAATFNGSIPVVSMLFERMATGANTLHPSHRHHNPSPARSIPSRSWVGDRTGERVLSPPKVRETAPERGALPCPGGVSWRLPCACPLRSSGAPTILSRHCSDGAASGRADAGTVPAAACWSRWRARSLSQGVALAAPPAPCGPGRPLPLTGRRHQVTGRLCISPSLTSRHMRRWRALRCVTPIGVWKARIHSSGLSIQTLRELRGSYEHKLQSSRPLLAVDRRVTLEWHSPCSSNNLYAARPIRDKGAIL